MALTADACLYPRWRLKAEVFWPAKELADCTRLAKDALNTGLIAQATVRATAAGLTGDQLDDASLYLVGWYAADGRLQQMGGLPSTVDVRDEGSNSYTDAQREWMEAFRDEMLAAYQAILDGQIEEGTSPMPVTSRSTRACIDLI